ncbi:hypothetical protein ECG_03574 [Echinococcus granulosus]|uniref:HTH_48 domain-containing protein n=1 Tax=Echinococcus granulosus TaxID=6210 RepID=A0A068WTI2_ECHGR|nr:hypothetical protein ECG_03574 [Echinococcus granulosus]CDS23467.1 hypothetical protein EgrG_002041900 [Echinococcus granulosus]
MGDGWIVTRLVPGSQSMSQQSIQSVRQVVNKHRIIKEVHYFSYSEFYRAKKKPRTPIKDERGKCFFWCTILTSRRPELQEEDEQLHQGTDSILTT